MSVKQVEALPAASSPASASRCRLMRRPLGWITVLLALLGAGVPLVWHTALLGGASSTSHGFKYRSYGEMAAYLKQLNETYPELVRVSVAQEQYSLPYPAQLTCVEDDATGAVVPCQQFIVHLTNHSSMPDADRPEVFISGALHGNERIGPITTVELIALMAKSATEYAASAWSGDAESDVEDDDDDAQRLGIQNTRRWLYELLQTRSIYIMPMTNAWGYAHDRREELDVDPNRDYNYMRTPQECMQAMTSRAVNEVWREHLFQLAITFHGGMRAISYEWGSPDHYLAGHARTSEKSPDHTAQFQLANVFAAYAGAFEDGTLYPTGTMNDVVYGVTGGMEDWAYAASWENEFVKKDKPFQPCQPATFGGYDAAKTEYNNLTHRAFNMLVETSNSKRPEEDALGFFEDLYNADLDYYELDKKFTAGHVTQNVRLALMMIDMVQPYIRWVHMSPAKQTATLMAQPGVFPSASWYVENAKQLKQLGCGVAKSDKTTVTLVSCDTRKCRIDASGDSHVKLQLAWEVLGAFRVDQTHVQVSSSKEFKRKDILLETTTQAGLTRRYFDFGSPDENEDTQDTSLFSACLDWNISFPHKVYVRAVATVDQDWATQGVGKDVPSPRIPPQSHLVNARTNADWDETWNGHRVKGRLQWHSPVISVRSASSAATSKSGADAQLASPAPTPSAVTKANGTSASDAGIDGGSSVVSDTQSSSVPTVVAVAPSASPTDSKTEGSNAGAGTESSIITDANADGSEDSSESGAEGTDRSGDDKVEEVEEQVEEEEEEEDDDVTSTPKTHPPKISVISNIGSEVTATKTTDSAVVKDPSDLLNMGYVVLASGGVVISMALLFLYRRVFRTKRQASYVSVNNQARGGRDDDDEEAEDEEEDEDDL